MMEEPCCVSPSDVPIICWGRDRHCCRCSWGLYLSVL